MKPLFTRMRWLLLSAMLIVLPALWADASSPLCFTARNGSVSVKFTVRNSSSNDIQYGTSDSTWFQYTSDTEITITSGQSVYFRAATDKTSATAAAFGSNGTIDPAFTFTSADGGTVEATGNIMSLYGPTCPDITLPDNAFRSLFSGCTLLTASPALPATQLGDNCYQYMFMNCKRLVAAPALPAMTLANECYSYMFFGCSSLTTASALPSTVMTERCYLQMFSQCSSLVSAPALPATVLAGHCYEGMFADCVSLTTATPLNAASLEENCYYSMFLNCRSLVSAPALPATTLATNCYGFMFCGCSSLTTIPTLPATTLTDGCYYYMFTNCSSIKMNNAAPGEEWTITADQVGTNSVSDMFTGTKGTMNGTPSVNVTYYFVPIKVTALVNDPDMGNVNISGNNSYGNIVTLTATQKPHYHFVNWSNGKTSFVITVAVFGDSVITAYFEPNPHTVTANVNDTAMGSVAGSGQYGYATTAILIAQPKPHHHLVAWSNGKTTDTISVPVYGDSVLSATFAIDRHVITVDVNDTAMGSATAGGTFDYGDTLTLTATAKPHHRFISWSNGEISPVITVVVDSNLHITANFALNPSYLFQERDTICQGDSLTWHGKVISVAGIYYDSLTSQYGEDSVYQLTLTVNPTYLFRKAHTICQGATYTWRKKQYGTAGVYYDSLTTFMGCDSVYELTLTVNPTYLIQEQDSVCHGDSLTWHGQVLSVAGIYYDSLTTVDGCDSVYELTLTVNPVYLTDETDTICQGDTLTWHGKRLSAAGVYYDSLTTIAGCDSVHRLTLAVNPSYVSYKSRTICQGGSYSWRKKKYSVAGVYYDSLTTVDGCDSVYVLTLTVNPTYLIQEQDSVCQGDSLTWHGQVLSVAGIYYDSLTTINGCDSVYELTLTVNPVYLIDETDTICQGETLTWHGKMLSAAGVYYDLLTTIAGCDSVHRLTLAVNPSYVSYKTRTICQGGSYSWRKKKYSVAGVYYDSLTTVDGCDSVYVLTLTVNPTYLIQEQDSVCQGDSLTWHGQVLSVAGIYYDSLTSIYGCDSVYELTLTVNPVYLIDETDTICQGETLTWHGKMLSAAGVYYDSLTTIAGCDSVHRLTLSINPSYVSYKSRTICMGDTYTWRRKKYTTKGVYYDSLTTIDGCDSVFVLTLAVNSSYHYIDYDTICQGDTYTWRDSVYKKAGVYYDSLTTINGCDSVYELNLTVRKSYLYKENWSLCGKPIVWHNSTISKDGVYYDSLKTAEGCDSIHQLTVTTEQHVIMLTVNYDNEGVAYYLDADGRHNRKVVYCGDSVEIHAVAFAHYHFVGWSDGSTDTVRTIIVTSDTIIQAKFDFNCGEWADWPASLLYNGLIVLNLNTVKSYGYFPDENEVRWFKVVDEPDQINSTFPQDDQFICNGYYLSLSEHPLGTGDYYAVVEVSDDVGVPCHEVMRTEIVFFNDGTQNIKVQIAPTRLGVGETLTVSGLMPDQQYTMIISDYSGRVVETLQTSGSERFEIMTHYPAGVYFVSIISASTRDAAKFIITK